MLPRQSAKRRWSRPPSGRWPRRLRQRERSTTTTCIIRVEPVTTVTSGPYEGYWKDMRSAGYVVDLPGFPLPLFSDPERQDATTAHLTVCASSSADPDSMSGQWDNGNGDFQSRGTFTATFYYDPTPEGDFTNLDTFCGVSEDAIELGGDVTIEPWIGREAPPTEISTTAETVVDRSVPVTGPNGETFMVPSPRGNPLAREEQRPWRRIYRSLGLRLSLMTPERRA